MNIEVRGELPSDIPAIESVTIAAFHGAQHTSHTEHFIVNALRKAGVLAVSLVAEADGHVVGHVAVSPVNISDMSPRWFGLGPISVSPAYQGMRIGAKLMNEALGRLRASGASGCVVLGEPAYYGRFGFRAEPTLVLPDVPPGYFQAVAFGGAIPTGAVSYHEAFEARE